MIVAWQFIARNAAKADPSRRERYDRFAVDSRVIMRGDRSRDRKSYRTLRDGSILNRLLVRPLPDQATIILSLRDLSDFAIFLGLFSGGVG